MCIRDRNRPYVEMHSFFRDYEGLSRDRILFEMKREKILNAFEVTRNASIMFLNYLEKKKFTIEDKAIQEQIIKKLKELEKLKEVRDAEEEEILYETRITH